MLTVYGASSCAQCKTFLSMAEHRGVETKYLLLDQDPDARLAYDAIDKTSRALPFVVYRNENAIVTACGLQAAIQLFPLIPKR